MKVEAKVTLLKNIDQGFVFKIENSFMLKTDHIEEDFIQVVRLETGTLFNLPEETEVEIVNGVFKEE